MPWTLQLWTPKLSLGIHSINIRQPVGNTGFKGFILQKFPITNTVGWSPGSTDTQRPFIQASLGEVVQVVRGLGVRGGAQSTSHHPHTAGTEKVLPTLGPAEHEGTVATSMSQIRGGLVGGGCRFLGPSSH